jgi:glycosyltransferase involved in cell wall biosynthesis
VEVYENKLRIKSENRFEAWKTNFVEKRIFRYSGLLIFPSHSAFETAKYFYKNLNNKCFFPHGIDIKITDSPVIEKQIEPLRAVFVGEFARTEKGLQFLIDSLSGSSADIILTVIGDKKDSTGLKINQKIIFINRVSHNSFLELLHSSNLFISASSLDSFSISALEAMALGLIPILTTATGLSEYLQDGKNSFIFRYGDAESLRKIIKLLDDNREMVISVSRAAKEFARGYSWGSIFKKFYLPLYEISSKKK